MSDHDFDESAAADFQFKSKRRNKPRGKKDNSKKDGHYGLPIEDKDKTSLECTTCSEQWQVLRKCRLNRAWAKGNECYFPRLGKNQPKMNPNFPIPKSKSKGPSAPHIELDSESEVASEEEQEDKYDEEEEARIRKYCKRMQTEQQSAKVIDCDLTLVTSGDGKKAHLYKRDNDNGLKKYSPVLKRWAKVSSIQMNEHDIAVQMPKAMEAALVETVQDLFDTGASHVMVKNSKLFKPGTMVRLENAYATTANGDRIKVEAYGTVRMCKLAMWIPSLVKNLTSLSHMRRSASWPGEYGVCSTIVTNVTTGEEIDALEVVQYHYQTVHPLEQKFAPYQVLAIAQAVTGTVYMMPESWLHCQEHLLEKDESDPHKFVGRDDRPVNGRWNPEGKPKEFRVNSIVMEEGLGAVRGCVDSDAYLGVRV